MEPKTFWVSQGFYVKAAKNTGNKLACTYLIVRVFIVGAKYVLVPSAYWFSYSL